MIRFLAPSVKALMPKLIVFDFEWSEDGSIYAASFVNEIEEAVIRSIDFPNEESFIETIQKTILKFPVSIGWATLGVQNSRESDLDNLAMNAERLGLEPIFDRQFRTIKNHEHIDLMRVFNKRLVQGSMYKNKYRDLKLETVSQCFLKRGKTGHGIEAHTYDAAKLKEYVLEDSRLVFDLLSVGMFDKKTDEPVFDGALLGTMSAIGKLCDVSFAKVCNGSLSQWWGKIFDTANAPPSIDEFKVKQGDERYKGGELIDPIPGLYKQVEVLDVQSLYPTIIILYNLSHETVCCECCQDDPKAVVPPEILDKGYWICRKQTGILVQYIDAMKKERVKQKEAGNTAQAEGLKILLNGAYGLYGSAFFKYSDRRVAELVTAYARWTNFHQIRPIAEMAGYQVVYGDTDSIFCIQVSPDAVINSIIETVKAELDVTVEHEKSFSDMVISKKKHYMGRQKQKDGSFKVIVKGIEWIKGDRSKWVNKTGKAIENAFNTGANCFDVVKKALDDLDNDRVPPEDLKVGIRLSKNPEDYVGNSFQKKIGELTGARAGFVGYFFKGIGGQPTLDVTLIDKKKYRELLMNTCEDVLKIMGHDTKEVASRQVQTIDSLWA